MSENALVSVIVPVYNGERFIDRTLLSALAQTYSPFEVVVVDDGSTDSTPYLIEAASIRDERIRVFRKENAGAAAARYFGIKQARGTLVAFLDADDLWHPEKIARQVEAMKRSSPNVGLVYCLTIEIDESDMVITSFVPPEATSTYQGRVTQEIAVRCFIDTPSTVLIKRACLEAVAGYDADSQLYGGEDWQMYFALSEVCEFAALREYLVGFRRAPGSQSTDIGRMAESIDCVIQWLNERWPNLSEDLRRERIYETNLWLARRALDSNQFPKALYYRANAAGLLNLSNVMFASQIFFRMIGLTRTNFRRRGWTFKPPTYFQDAMRSWN